MINKKQINPYYAKLIDEIESVRARNNVNWMDILRLAFTYAPEEARLLMQQVNKSDQEISQLLSSLSELPPGGEI